MTVARFSRRRLVALAAALAVAAPGLVAAQAKPDRKSVV